MRGPLDFHYAEGQIISKGLCGILKFSQKTNERIRRNSKNEFVRSFFGRIQGDQKFFRNYLTFNDFIYHLVLSRLFSRRVHVIQRVT